MAGARDAGPHRLALSGAARLSHFEERGPEEESGDHLSDDARLTEAAHDPAGATPGDEDDECLKGQYG